VKIRFLCLLAALLFGLTSAASAANDMELILSTDSVVMSECLGIWGSLSWDGPDVSADVYLLVFDDYGGFGFLYPGCSRSQPWPTQFMGNVFVPSGATIAQYYIGGFPVERFVLQEPFGRHHVGIAMTERGTLNIIAGPVFEAFEILPSPLIWRGPRASIRFEYDEMEGVWALVEARMSIAIEIYFLYTKHHTNHETAVLTGWWPMDSNWRRSIELAWGEKPGYYHPFRLLFEMAIDVQPLGADVHLSAQHRARWERGDADAESWVGPAQVHHLPPP